MIAMAGNIASNPPRRRAAAQPAAAPRPTPTADAQLARLHDLHRKPIFNYLAKLTLGDIRLAEDILQETFLRAWRHLTQHEDTNLEDFRPWLYLVARRLVVDMLRSRRSRPAEVVLDDLTQLSVSEDTIASLVSAHAVRDALMRLRPEHRAVLIQLYYYGRSPREVADMLGIPVGTVKSRAYYAKQGLRFHLDQ